MFAGTAALSHTSSRDLSLSASAERISEGTDKCRILLKINTSNIGTIKSVSVRIGTPQQEDALLLQGLSREMIEGSKDLPNLKAKEHAITSVTREGDWVNMALESFASGEYEVFVKVMDGNRRSHMTVQNIVVE